MNWFGWLVKNRCEVTMLDNVIGFGEFVVLLVVCCGIWFMVDALHQ